jgi:tight adherence protein B
MAAITALLGAGIAAGVLLIAVGFRRREHRPADTGQTRQVLARTGLTTVRGLIAVVFGLVVALLTGWPVGGLLAAVAALTHAASLASMDAVASWAEDLAGTMRAARGLDQAVMQTSQTAPTALAPQLQQLAGSLRRGQPLPTALRAFADDLADPTVDLIIAVLLYAATRPARDIASSLDAVAATARRQAAARMRIAASRARSRSAARIVTAVIVTVVAGTNVLAADFLASYATASGQVRLAALGVAAGVCLWWMHRLARIPDLPRILTGSTS